MTVNSGRESGFALIVAMIILAVLTVLVVNSMRATTFSERMSFSYMDRALAQQAAEQALREAGARLIENGAMCARNVDDTTILGCVVTASSVTAATGSTAQTLPTTWSDTGAIPITALGSQTSSAKYSVQLLNTSTTNCWLYSIMAEGKGHESNTRVVLQTVARLCSQ